MIGLYDDDGNRLPIDFNSLTLNDPDDDEDDTFEVNVVGTVGQYDQVTDSDPAQDGTEVGPVKRSLYVVRLEGVVRAPTIAKLFDKKHLLAETFDPALLSYLNESTYGVKALDFSVPTTDTANYPTGFVPSRYYARPRGAVIPPDSQFTGLAAFFAVELLIPDPRRYLQTESTLDGTGTINNSLATYPSWPTITITASGAGNAAYTLTRTGTYSTKSLVLNMSGLVASDVVTVDMATKTIEKNGTEAPQLYVSGDYWEIEPNSQTFSHSNATNMAPDVAWRRAFVA